MPRIKDRDRVLDLLRETEGLSSRQIKADLKLSDERYNVVRQHLLAKKLVTKYACRGGGIRLNPEGHKPLAHDGLSSPTGGGSGLGSRDDDDLIRKAKDRYVRELDRYKKLADYVHEKCKNIVKDDAIRATTQARAKDPDSFAEKTRRYLFTR